MRSRIAILSAFLLFSAITATPAYAGPWSAFVAWLSDLDPKSGGLGLEMSLFCPLSEGASGQTARDSVGCVFGDKHKVRIKASAAFQLGTLSETGGTIFVVPVLGIVEKSVGPIYLGAGAGVIHVGGTLVGSVTQPLIQPVRITVPIQKIDFAIRLELNVLPKGFPAGAFAVGAPEKGTEVALGISFIYLR